MTGFIYAIEGESGHIKIGWSGDPLRRLAEVQTYSPMRATLLGLVPATRVQETELHLLLAPWCVHGEWYRHEGPVLAFVEMLPRPKPRPHPLRGRPPQTNTRVPQLEEFIQKNSTQAQFARAIGCSESHLSLVLSGARAMSFALAKRVFKAINGEVPLEALPSDRAA